MWEVLKVHAAAISRTWQWTASLVQARALTMPTTGPTQPDAPPPPPPPRECPQPSSPRSGFEGALCEEDARARNAELAPTEEIAATLEYPVLNTADDLASGSVSADSRAAPVAFDEEMVDSSHIGGEADDRGVLADDALAAVDHPMVGLSDSDECS
eukprot:4168309-Amphidinium_carterae.1